MALTRRTFLTGLIAAAAGLRARGGRLQPPSIDSLGLPIPSREFHGESSVAAAFRASGTRRIARATRPLLAAPDVERLGRDLRTRFPDLRRHVVFEYYAWYRTDPWFHWDEAGRRPPLDIASNYMPRLGPYDSRDRAALEQHARWIASTGAGAVNLSWWGPDSYSDSNAHLVMDVMRDHDIHVAFHLEPYRVDRVELYAQDILHLVRTYGDRRGWDAFLLPRDADGRVGPVFKSFRTILPPETTDCHGITSRVPDWAPDTAWRAQTTRVREDLRHDFDRVTLLVDSLDVERSAAAGFDGIAIYDNFVEPATWPEHARNCRGRDLLFAFNVNPGYDAIVLRDVEPGSCYRPAPFLPRDEDLEWTAARDRRRAQRLSTTRIRESFATTVALQADPSLPNARRGFFLLYVNSFNEWYEGHQAEPMQDWDALAPDARAMGYHNPADGAYRLRALAEVLRALLDRPAHV